MRDPMATEPVQTEATSLSGRLFRGLVLPMVGLALVLGIGGAWAIDEAVESVNDRILGAAARAIADSLSVEQNSVTLDLPPSAFSMLEDNARDNVYYNVRQSSGSITGYADLPHVAPVGLGEGQLAFGKAIYRGSPVRIVAEARRLPNFKGLVIVEVAETLGARERISNRMRLGLALLEFVLIGVAMLLIPVAVGWGLRPLARIRAEMDARTTEFTPLPLADVPVELRELVSAFNGLLGRLDAAVRGIRRFSADASHQMRTPLSILRTHIAVLRSAEPGSEMANNSIIDIDQATDRLRHLLVQLLALARADGADQARLPFQPIDMNALTRQIAEDHVPQALSAGLDLHFDAADDPAIVQANPDLLTELLTNLVDNAIRYNDSGKTVGVTVATASDTVCITVEDDGPGIAPEDRERVFDRFTRLDSNPSRTGSGLGLSIARAIAEALGAVIVLDSGADGRGLRISLELDRVS